jgi:hypothetical protein
MAHGCLFVSRLVEGKPVVALAIPFNPASFPPLVQVLDARDPNGTRCRHLEQHLKRNARHKHMLLLLNKCDLVSERCCAGPALVPGLCEGQPALAGTCSRLGGSQRATCDRAALRLASTATRAAGLLTPIWARCCAGRRHLAAAGASLGDQALAAHAVA